MKFSRDKKKLIRGWFFNEHRWIRILKKSDFIYHNDTTIFIFYYAKKILHEKKYGQKSDKNSKF